MERRAVPWMTDVDCCGKRVNFDQELEKYGLGVLPPQYERSLEKFFKTKDKVEMLRKALRSKQVPVWCKNCNRVEIVDTESGECMDNCKRRASMSNVGMKVARELTLLAKELAAFWDLTIVPPSASDVDRAKKVVEAALVKKGMKCDKLAFQRYMVYQENKECSGPNCRRNSNKHLCVFGYEDKDGTFGGGVAGGRIGENNQPKLYQDWGITGDGASGERTIRALIDKYIRKKTSQSDGYKEVKVASVKTASQPMGHRVAAELLKLAKAISAEDIETEDKE